MLELWFPKDGSIGPLSVVFMSVLGVDLGESSYRAGVEGQEALGSAKGVLESFVSESISTFQSFCAPLGSFKITTIGVFVYQSPPRTLSKNTLSNDGIISTYYNRK